MKLLPLTNSLQPALVDDDDHDALLQRKWYHHPSGRVANTVPLPEMNTGSPGSWVSYTTAYLHREIMGIGRGDDRVVIHLDGDYLNNQRGNLRVVTRGQVPRRKHRGSGSSRYTGLTRHRNGWIVRITAAGRRYYLGRFPLHQEELAARVYDEAARKLHGWRALLNFPYASPHQRAEARSILATRVDLDASGGAIRHSGTLPFDDHPVPPLQNFIGEDESSSTSKGNNHV